MLPLRRARDLLASVSTLEHLADIAREIGFAGPARNLDAATREGIGIPAEVTHLRIIRGAGSARALLLDIGAGTPFKDVLAHTASRLAARAPQLLWLLIAIDGKRTHVAILTFSRERNPPRVRALLCERARVIDSDAETLCALASTRGHLDVMMHFRWTEILGRDALTRRFFATLEGVVTSLAASAARSLDGEKSRELSLLYVSRLLFLSFLETQGWLNGDHGFLANGFADAMASGGRYHKRVLLPLFFGTLNTPRRARSPRAQAFGAIPFLNGGLFSRSPLERRMGAAEFSDEAMGALYGDLLCRHRFTPREDSGEWSEAAVDPEMLGKAFESLMLASDRKSSGAFYTPQSLVERMMREALAHALQSSSVSAGQIESFLLARRVHGDARAPLLARVRSIRVLDPACGSGAFLVYALGELTWLASACGDPRPRGELTRSILTSSIFGVDINPMAVWLCELRLWLAIVMEQRDEGVAAVTPLPNLDRQIRTGDTLTGGSFTSVEPVSRQAVARIRARYTRAHGARKKSLAQQLDRAERVIAIAAIEREIHSAAHSRHEQLNFARSRDLFGVRHPPSAELRTALAEARRSLRELRGRKQRLQAGAALPFSFRVQFPEVAASGGFGVVIGNPPWVRLHRIPPRMRERLKQEFDVFKGPAWRDGAEAARAGSGFGSQVDMSALFVERSIDLLRHDGVLALLLPAKLWSSQSGGSVREIIGKRASLLTLEDLSNAPASFAAAVYPSLMLARPVKPGQPRHASASLAVHRRERIFAWRMRPESIALDGTIGSPWIITPPDVRRAFDKLRSVGIPLAETRMGRPMLGVKSGCNEAFVVTATGDPTAGETTVRSGDRSGSVEHSLLRRVIKGEDLAAWRCAATDSRVIWTHGHDGRAIAKLPPAAKQWLGHFRKRLQARTDGRSSERWWTLFRTEGVACDRPRVVWADVGKRPRAAVLDKGNDSVPLNSCYVLRCRDQREALALAAILNSDIAAAWLNLIAEPARGGYHRYLGWTIALLPLPRDWTAACATLPEIAQRAINGCADSRELLDAVLRAYGIKHDEVASLLAWMD